MAQQFAAGLTFDAFASDVLVRSAIERQLEILGEACQRMVSVDADIRRRLPEVGFAIGLRNRIIHGYDRIENAVVFDTVVQDLPALADGLAAELAKQPQP